MKHDSVRKSELCDEAFLRILPLLKAHCCHTIILHPLGKTGSSQKIVDFPTSRTALSDSPKKVAVCKNSGSRVSALLSLVVTAVGIPRRNTDTADVLLVKTNILRHLMSESPLSKGGFYVETSSGREFPAKFDNGRFVIDDS